MPRGRLIGAVRLENRLEGQDGTARGGRVEALARAEHRTNAAAVRAMTARYQVARRANKFSEDGAPAYRGLAGRRQK
jgi:hypothetical protein